MNLSQTDLKALLQRHFSRDEFEPDQEEIITSVLSGRDVLAVTHGRFDRSLCYKLPAMVLDSLTVVVSRSGHIAESVDLLPAIHINNSLHSGHLQNWIWSIAQGKYKLVYAGPEQFRNRAFLFALTKVPISLLVIEDAHCISRWGQDFRPDYLDISKAITEMDSQPRIIALAGACTRRTRDDIRYQLQIHDAKTVLTDLIRPDLSLEVMSVLSSEDKYDALGSLIQKLDGSGIVYTRSHRQTIEICEFLREYEPKVAAYHAGIERGKRIQTERAFAEGKLRVIVATNSFRATLNEPVIKYIINFDMPDRLERYYQQISSAGGNGGSARCILIYSPSDRDFHRSMIEMNTMLPAEVWRISDVLYHHAKDDLEAMPLPIESAEQWSRMSFQRELNNWLREHFQSIPPEKKKELDRLRDDYEELDGWDKNPYPPEKYDKYLAGEHWREFSRLMTDEHEQCQVCGSESRCVHHLHYRTLMKEQPEDVMVLCDRCHCFIHPNSPMTKKIFEEIRESRENQPKLFDAPKLSADPLVVLPYGQMELEAAVDRYKLRAILREMESAGALSILPDCSMQAQVNILVPRDKLKKHAEDEAGQLVVKWLLKKSESDPAGEIHVDLAALKNQLSCQHDALEESFLALHYAKAISYRSTRRGMAFRLINTDFSPAEDAFEKLKGSRYKALRAVEEYINTRECRQRFLCNYLGYETGENCGKCDNCGASAAGTFARGHMPLPHYARVALELVNRSDGGMDKGAIARILAGGEQRTTRFDKWEGYGALSMFAPEDILKVLDFLIGHGFLEEEAGSRAPVSLTDKGFRALNGEFEGDDADSIASLTADMKRIAPSEKPQRAEAESEHDRILIALLRCAEKTDGQVGRSGLVKMLRGQKSKKLAKYEFDHMEEYGSLSDMPKKVVLEHIDKMLERGCLTVTSFIFPMLRLTERGQKRLDRTKQNL